MMKGQDGGIALSAVEEAVLYGVIVFMSGPAESAKLSTLADFVVSVAAKSHGKADG